MVATIVRIVARASDLDRLFVRCIAEGTGGWWMVGGMGFIKKVIIGLKKCLEIPPDIYPCLNANFTIVVSFF